MHAYRESVYLGDCGLAKEQVQLILGGLKAGWMGPTYDLLRKNCCSFSREFALELGVGEVPAWIDRLAKWGAALSKKKKKAQPQPGDEEWDDPTDMNTLFMEHVVAARVQAKWRAKKGQRTRAAS